MEHKKMTFDNLKNFMGSLGTSVDREDIKFFDEDENFFYIVPNNKSLFIDEYIKSHPPVLSGDWSYPIKTKPCKSTVISFAKRSSCLEVEEELPFYGDKNTNLAQYVKNFEKSKYFISNN